MVAVLDELKIPIGGVPSSEIMKVWAKVEPILARVVKPHTGYDLDALLTSLQLAKSQLWIIGDFQAVGITEIQERPLHRVLWCQFVVGDNVDEWLDDWETLLAAYGREHNCVAVEFSGRKGWHKFQQRFRNYKPVLVTYRREL